MTDPRASAEIDAARDAAQQIVTAVIHQDRETAFKLAQEYMAAAVEPMALPLVMADLTAYVHDRWTGVMAGLAGTADHIGARADGWAALMADIEDWREGART